MPLEHAGLLKELEYITKPFENKHIRSLFEDTDPNMHDIAYALIKGDNNEVDRLTAKALEDDFSANTIMDDGLIAGMAIVGIKFRDNMIFVPEVLISARAMKAGMAHIEPILSESGIEPVGTVIMGTVKGDLHDIGKGLVASMLEGGGFEVVDLGVDIPPEKFVSQARESGADIIAVSALLTTTMTGMKAVVDAVREAGLANQVKVIIGGAPVTQQYADSIGASGYTDNASAAVALARALCAA